MIYKANLTKEKRNELNIFLTILSNVLNSLFSLDRHFFDDLTITKQIILFNTLDRLVFKIPNIFRHCDAYYYFGEDESDGFENRNILVETFENRYISNIITGSISLDDYFNGFKTLLNDYLNGLSLTNGEKEKLNQIIRNINRLYDTLSICKFEDYEKNDLVITLDKIFEYK